MKPRTDTHPRPLALSGRFFVPAAVALALSWTAPAVQADQAGRDAINAILATYSQQAGLAANRTVTIATATPDFLANAVAQYVAGGATPALRAARAAQAVQSALEVPNGGRVRRDKDKIAGRIVNAAIQGGNLTGDAVAIGDAVAAAVSANRVVAPGDTGVTANTRNQLTATGQAAAAASALRAAVTATAGQEVADSVQAVAGVFPTQTTATTFAINTLRLVSTDVQAVTSFVDALEDAAGATSANSTFVTTVATGAARNPLAAGEAFAANVTGLTLEQAAATTKTAVQNRAFAKIVAEIASGGASNVPDAQLSTFANTVTSGIQIALKGAVVGGVVAEADSAATVPAIVNGVLASPDFSTARARAQFAAGAAKNNGDEAAKISAIATAVTNSFSGADVVNIGAAIATSIANGPATGTEALTNAIIASAGTTTATQVAFARTLGKGASRSNEALRGISRALVAQNSATAVPLTQGLVRAYTRAATGVARGAADAQLASGPANGLGAFARALLTGPSNTAVSAGSAPLIATGIALADETQTASIATSVVDATTSTKKAVARIVLPVALAVSEEQSAEIALGVGALFTGASREPVSINQATALAQALARAVQTKPMVSLTNRIDELGEIAASVVSRVIGKGSQATQTKLISGIGAAIFKSLSKRLLPNVGNFQADPTDATQDIAGAIAQAISVAAVNPNSTFTAEFRDSLLSPNGALFNSLSRAAGRAYSSLVAAAFNEVNSAASTPGRIFIGTNPEVISRPGQPLQVGKYEIGSVIDPETPSKNI